MGPLLFIFWIPRLLTVKRKRLSPMLSFSILFRTPKGGKSYASSIPKRQVKTLPKEE